MSDPSLLLFIVASLLWFALALRYPRGAVWALMLWLPIQGWVQLNVFDDSSRTVLLYEYQIVGLYLIFAARAFRAPDTFGPPRVVRFAIPFVIWALLLIPYSISQNGLVVTLIGLRTYVLPLPLVWIGYRAFTTWRQFEIVSVALMLQLVVIAVVTLLQYTSLTSMSGVIFELPRGFTATTVVRPPGTFSHPAHLGNYIIFSVPFAIGLLGLTTAYWRHACFALGLAGATVALMANTQRAVIVMLAVLVPVMVVLSRSRRAVAMMVVALSIIVGAGVVIGNPVAGDAFRERVSTISVDLRITLIQNPMDRLNDALAGPVYGDGLGVASPGANRLDPGFESGALARGSELAIRWGESFIPALVFDTGVPGLVLFYIFVWAVVRETIRARRPLGRTDIGLLIAGVIAYQIATILHSWPYGPLHTPPARVLFWFWAGVVWSLPRLAAQRTGQRPIPAARTTPPRVTTAARPVYSRVSGGRRVV